MSTANRLGIWPGLNRRDFRLVAQNGFGDGNNAYAHSMAWFNDRLYVGTTRGNFPFMKSRLPIGMNVWPVECPPNPFDIDMHAEIWCYDPLDDRWERVFKAPTIIGSHGKPIPRELGLRGMLVYSGSLPSVTRVAGRHGDPTIGPHRGAAIDLLETGGDAVYVISRDDAGVYAQVACEDEVCVAASVRALPPGPWVFGSRVARGKQSVSVVATSGAREFLLHRRGKSDGWLLDELPTGERPTWMWASEEGGLWTRTGERIRWRDTEGAWREIALPEGLSTPSVALTEDRKQVWVSGVVDGAPRIFTAPANAQAK